MQYYSIKLRLDGSPMHELRKVVSVPELLVLQYIHGVDAIGDVQIVKEERVNLREVKEKLKSDFDPSLAKREQSIDKIFGSLGTVPEYLPEDLVERFGVMLGSDPISIAKAVTASDKNNSNGQRVTQIEQERLDRIVPADTVNLADMAG